MKVAEHLSACLRVDRHGIEQMSTVKEGRGRSAVTSAVLPL